MRNEDGKAAAEFALLIAMLTFMIVGAVAFLNYVNERATAERQQTFEQSGVGNVEDFDVDDYGTLLTEVADAFTTVSEALSSR